MRQIIFIVVLISLIPLCPYSTLSEEKPTAGCAMPGLRAIILDMARKDQAVRENLTGTALPSAGLEKKIRDVDTYNTEMVKEIYPKNGWPYASMIGRDGVNAFWLLVQHATDLRMHDLPLPVE